MHFPTALVALGATLASALPQVEIKGNQFYFPRNGSEFKIRGLAYQPGGQESFKGDGKDKHDPLSVPEICKRDAPIIQSLGANLIRVYNLHSDLNHDECVSVFNDAGIYLMLDVNSPEVNSHINKDDPKSTYHLGYLESIFKVIDAFKGYDNVIGFFSGNEIIDDLDHAKKNPPYIRAVTRDMREYIDNHADRFIAVGYAGTDTRSDSSAGIDSVTDLWNYLRCRSEDDNYSHADFFAVNIYSWCDDATFEESGYPGLVKDFKETSLPVFWSEHGCNEGKRLYGEVPAMYGRQDMIDTFAGGIVFEYSNETNNYGLVQIDKEDKSVELLSHFGQLRKQYDSVDWDKIKNTKSDSFKTVEAPLCKDIKIKGKDFPSDFSKVPPPPFDADDLRKNGSGQKNLGKLLSKVSYDHPYKIRDTNDKDVTSQFKINKNGDAGISDAVNNNGKGGNGDNKDGNGGNDEGAAGSVAASMLAVVAPMVAGLFLF